MFKKLAGTSYQVFRWYPVRIFDLSRWWSSARCTMSSYLADLHQIFEFCVHEAARYASASCLWLFLRFRMSRWWSSARCPVRLCEAITRRISIKSWTLCKWSGLVHISKLPATDFHVVCCPGGEVPQDVQYDFVKLLHGGFPSILGHLCPWSFPIRIYKLSVMIIIWLTGPVNS
jgi:hypothetical protein